MIKLTGAKTWNFDSITSKKRGLFLFSDAYRLALPPTLFLFNDSRRFFTGEKWPRIETDHPHTYDFMMGTEQFCKYRNNNNNNKHHYNNNFAMGEHVC
jgi:hypothetical protein